MLKLEPLLTPRRLKLSVLPELLVLRLLESLLILSLDNLVLAETPHIVSPSLALAKSDEDRPEAIELGAKALLNPFLLLLLLLSSFVKTFFSFKSFRVDLGLFRCKRGESFPINVEGGDLFDLEEAADNLLLSLSSSLTLGELPQL